jgi:hypothetical protein
VKERCREVGNAVADTVPFRIGKQRREITMKGRDLLLMKVIGGGIGNRNILSGLTKRIGKQRGEIMMKGRDLLLMKVIGSGTGNRNILPGMAKG